ncbi:MAG: FAD-dependent oxidoreductase, partial [bacterium]
MDAKAVVVGAGIIGLASACKLAEAGYAVTVIERASAAGSGSSKANAGQLLFDRIGAMGSPGFLRSLPRTILDPTQGVRATGLANPAQWQWAGQFLRQCTVRAWQTNTARLLNLAHISRDAMVEFRTRHQLDFDWRRPGKLVTCATAEGLAAAQ